MGFFNWLTGNKPAPAGVKRQPVAKLREELMAVNRKTAPFTVRSGKKEDVDLVAEWRTRSSPRPGSSGSSRC